jgi:hypothetical protein
VLIQDFAKLLGTTEILGFAYGGKKLTLGSFWFAEDNFWFTHGLQIVKIIVQML